MPDSGRDSVRGTYVQIGTIVAEFTDVISTRIPSDASAAVALRTH
jgi:hypothetical protein